MCRRMDEYPVQGGKEDPWTQSTVSTHVTNGSDSNESKVQSLINTASILLMARDKSGISQYKCMGEGWAPNHATNWSPSIT